MSAWSFAGALAVACFGGLQRLRDFLPAACPDSLKVASLVQVYVLMCMYLCMRACTKNERLVAQGAYMHARKYVCVCVCLFVCVCVRVCLCVWVY